MEGDFTVESDRHVVKRLGEAALEHKIQNLSTTGPLNLYRFFLARRSKMLGEPAATWEVEQFLRHFKFHDLDTAIFGPGQHECIAVCHLLWGCEDAPFLGAEEGRCEQQWLGFMKLRHFSKCLLNNHKIWDDNDSMTFNIL